MTTSSRLRLLAPLLLLAGACNSGAKLAAAKFSGPSALAPFMGYTKKHPGAAQPLPYLAVANLLRDEISIVDPLDNGLVIGPTLSFPLAVATRPRPFRLAAAPLEADGDPDRGADLLVVATQSPPSLQLVTTWDEDLRAEDLAVDDDLATAFPGSAVLSLTAARRPGGGAWVFAGLSGGHLAVLEFERDPTSTLPAPLRPIRRTSLALQRKDLATGAGRFDPLDLSLAPDGSRLFVATADPLQDAAGATISGLGQVTVAASAAAAWPVVGLDARAPTRLVASGLVIERTRASSVVFESTPSLRAYAVLDEAGCGPRRAIGCGIATILPDLGIAPDPAAELPYRAPINLGGSPVAMTLAMPPSGGDAGTPVGVSFASPPASPIELMSLEPSRAGISPIRFWQTALLAVAVADGRVLAVDPGRWGPVNDLQRSDADRSLLVSGGSNTVGVENGLKLGLWDEAAQAVETDVTKMGKLIGSTVGYTPDDTLVISWKGVLPGLSVRDGVLQWDGARPVVAVQVGSVPVVQVSDPELGVRVGDHVQVVPPVACNRDGATELGFSATVTAILQPSSAFPGGALALSHAGAGGTQFADDTPCATPVSLVDAAAPGPLASTLTVRVPGLLLASEEGGLGYLGRPALGQDFELRWSDEALLSGEELAVARKLRRRFYPTDAPCGVEIPGTGSASTAATVSECPAGAPVDPLTPGPALRLRVGVEGGGTTPGAGARLQLFCSSGMRLVRWASPVTLGVPTSIAWLDGTTVADGRPLALYAAFTSDEVLGILPLNGTLTSIR